MDRNGQVLHNATDSHNVQRPGPAQLRPGTWLRNVIRIHRTLYVAIPPRLAAHLQADATSRLTLTATAPGQATVTNIAPSRA